MSPDERRALSAFAALPARERWFVRGRMASAPLARVAARVEGRRILDIGCGHGALSALLAVDRPDRSVTGIDPDARKVEWAARSVGRLPNVEVLAGTADALLPDRERAFDTVLIADVLYVIPIERWGDVLTAALRLLAPGGQLLLHEAEADRSWRHLKWMLQELVMVRVVRRTRSSGGLQARPRAYTEELLRRVGFERVRSTPMGVGYTTPHLLIEARRPER